MTTYITRVGREFDRKEANRYFGKVGKGRAYLSIVIIETDKSLEEVEAFPGVVHAYEDMAMERESTTIVPNPGGEPGQAIKQTNAGWALRNLSRPYDDAYYHNRGGNNVDIYVVDTGVSDQNPELSGRVFHLHSGDDKDYDPQDEHGTMVAACAAGKNSGVAKNADIYSLRVVFSDIFSRAQIIKSLDTVAWHHWAKETGNPSVVCMSYGSITSTAHEDTKWNNDYKWIHHDLKTRGIVLVSSAGNRGLKYSPYNDAGGTIAIPSAYLDVISVGAHNQSRVRSVWGGPGSESSYGPGVDLFAPGTDVPTSRTYGSPAQMNGTSFSAPLVCGAIALLLEGSSKPSTQEQVNAVRDSLFNNLCAADMNMVGTTDTPNRCLKTYNYPFWAGFSPMFP